MKRVQLLCLVAFVLMQSFCFANDEHKTLAIGAAAPDFKLPGVDGKTYSLNSFKTVGILVIIFTCNHCPTAQAYEDRIIKLTNDYKNKGAAVVAIMPNDPNAVRLDELGYTDMGDSFKEMKLRTKQKDFNFPYLYDGETQSTAKAYGPAVTPHVFIFDKERKLRYEGRIDDVEKPSKTPNTNDARNAIETLLNNKELIAPTTKVFGCSIKWAEKENWVDKAKTDWANEAVSVEMIDENGIKALVKNSSNKLRLINIWATWCGPCVTEFPSFITINRMYRNRDFEYISISADDAEKKDKVLQFLKKQQASGTNYLFSVDDKYKLIDAIDPNWKGGLPYTILVEPGGKIVYKSDGIIDEAELKKAIVDDRYIGRYY